MLQQVNRVCVSGAPGPPALPQQKPPHPCGSKERLRNPGSGDLAYLVLQPTRLMLPFFLDLEQTDLQTHCFHILSINEF